MVKCPRCGYENSSTAVYCDNCAYLLTDANGNRINNSKRTSSWNIGFAKKVAIILGIIAISLLLFSFIYNITQRNVFLMRFCPFLYTVTSTTGPR